MYHIEDVMCAYDNHIVFEHLTVNIKKGQYLILMGENGRGKSTFINLIAGFIAPLSGKLSFDSQDLSQLLKHNKTKRQFYARLGILFQDVDVQLFNRTVYDEVAFSLRQLEVSEEVIEQRVMDVLELFHITHLKDRVPYQLSGGEKKKVAFASIMVINPDVYILDEPFNNLAKEADYLLKEVLHELHIFGKTIIMSSHHFKHVNHEEADILLFEDKRVRYFTADQVKADQAIQDILAKY